MTKHWYTSVAAGHSKRVEAVVHSNQRDMNGHSLAGGSLYRAGWILNKSHHLGTSRTRCYSTFVRRLVHLALLTQWESRAQRSKRVGQLHLTNREA
jgi:hypothetical protein